MAKFLRVIFNLLLICYIAAALALFVPPLVGVSTAVTVEGTEGNQELGAVNYGWRIPLRSLQPGDEILVTGSNSVNVYAVQAVDAENAVITAADAEATQIAVRTYVYKRIFTVPYLGYIAIGMQTVEGMVILAATAAALLVLCILTAIWCRKRKIKRMKEEEEDLVNEDENDFFQNLASQKREADEIAEVRFQRQQKAVKEADSSRPALDEEYEEFVFEEAPAEREGTEVTAEEEETDEQPAAPAGSDLEADASEEGQGGEPEAELLETTDTQMEVERTVETGNIPGVQAALEAALNTQQIQRHVKRTETVKEPEAEAEPLAAEEIELAMPVYTVDEFLQKAYSAGEDPVVRKDELTGVTYIDYSECL